MALYQAVFLYVIIFRLQCAFFLYEMFLISLSDLLDWCFCFSWGRLCWSFLVVLLPPITNTFLQLQNTPGFTTCKCL